MTTNPKTLTAQVLTDLRITARLNQDDVLIHAIGLVDGSERAIRTARGFGVRYGGGYMPSEESQIVGMTVAAARALCLATVNEIKSYREVV